MLLKRLQIFFMAWMLLISQSVLAFDISSLSEQELGAAKKLGLSENDIKSFDGDTLKETLKDKLNSEKEEFQQEAKEKFQATVKNTIEPKLEEVKAAIEKEKLELKKDATKLAAGYITSTISLFAATLIAPQVIMVCKTKPSAIVYAGTAAVYILQEMRNLKVLKASQLAEIEIVDNLSIDRTKSAKENAKMLEDKVDQQVGYIKAYKNTLDHAVTALKKKAKNAKIVSIGFLAASATAAAEQMDWISGGGTCVTTTSLEKINFSKSLDDKYAGLIKGAKKTEDKWAYYYEWESLKFGTDRTISPHEYSELKKTPVTDSILTNAMAFIQSNILASALAAEDSKKVTVAAQLKDNKAADWIGDLDKLGIVGGLAINVVAYMAGWQMGFLKSVMASGTSRAITFGAQAALAFTAGKLFDDAASDLGKKLEKVEKLINKVQGVAKKGINFVVPSDADARRFQEIATKFGIPSDKLITEMSINDATTYIKQIKEKFENLDDEGKALVKKYEAEISEKLKGKAQEKVEEVKEKVEATTRWPGFMEFLFSSAVAAKVEVPYIVTKIRDVGCVEKKSCPVIQFPKSGNPNAKLLNQYLGLYERYYQGVKYNNQAIEDNAADALSKNKNLMMNYRNGVFKKNQEKNKSPYTDYNQFERAKIADEVNQFTKFYNSLPAQDRIEMDARLNPASINFAAAATIDTPKKTFSGKKNLKLTSEDRRILSLLVDRLEAKESITEGPDMSFVEREAPLEDEYNYGNTSIHPKEAELFDIIHIRYLKFLKKNFPEL